MKHVVAETKLDGINFCWKLSLNPESNHPNEKSLWGGFLPPDDDGWLRDMETSVMYIRKEYEKWKEQTK